MSRPGQMVILSTTSLVVFLSVLTTIPVTGQDQPKGSRTPNQEQFDAMKSAFDKLAEDNSKIADQLRKLNSRFETTTKDTTSRITKLEECKACERLTSLETTRIELTNGLTAVQKDLASR